MKSMRIMGVLRANLESLKARREKLSYTFEMKCIKSENPRMNDIFSKKVNYTWNGPKKI